MANEKLVNRENLKAFREKYDDRLTSGQLVVSKSLTAKELETISQESGDIQETPFALQGTGTANGTSSADTGTVGKHIQKQGSVYCVNQWVNFTPIGSSWLLLDAQRIEIKTTASSYTNSVKTLEKPIPAGHKVLYVLDYVSGEMTGNNQVGGFNSNSFFEGSIRLNSYSGTTINKGLNFAITTVVKDITSIRFKLSSISVSADYVAYFNIIDLTQWFNGNIPQDLLDHPEHWSWYQTYGDYIPYNTGTLVSGNGRYLVCGGRNLFDETQAVVGYLTQNGNVDSSATAYHTSPFILVNKYTDYYVSRTDSSRMKFYDENKQPLNTNQWDGGLSGSAGHFNTQKATYVRFSISNFYYNNTFFSLYYAGEDYSQYYPYEQPKVYDTGDEELLSTGVKLSVSGEREDAYDYKEPNGTITRRVGIVDLGTLTWTYISQLNGFRTAGLRSLIANGSNIFCSKYKKVASLNSESIATEDKVIGCNKSPTTTTGYLVTGDVFIKDTSYTDDADIFKTAMNGIYLYYELATPTTEQGTPFSENIEINDFGTMGWYATYTDANTNALVSVPQGCKIFYPAWYVGFIDTLGQRADIDWNANNVVSQSELSQYVKQVDLSSEITDIAGLTYQCKKAYKTGNIVTLTILAVANSNISANTTLLTLSYNLRPLNRFFTFGRITGSNTAFEIGDSSINGNCSCQDAITSSSVIKFTVTYAVA